MREKHLTYFKVENFKRFESFEMENIGQFNLILGDNNCGKSTVLEALLFDENPRKIVARYEYALSSRKISYNNPDVNYFKYFYNIQKQNAIKFIYANIGSPLQKEMSLHATTIDLLSDSESKKIQTKIALNQGEKNLIEISSGTGRTLDFQSDMAGSGDVYIPFVGYGLGNGQDLADFFSTIQNSTKVFEEFRQYLKLFIPDLANVELSKAPDVEDEQLIIREESRDQPLLLAMYGEGTVKLFRILLEIAKCKGHRLMIDEVDTGVHYSHFKDFWKTILKAAKRNDVQIFATTHNLECLKYLKECLEDDDMKEYQSLTNCFELRELPDKSVKAYNYNFDEFENAINSNINIRGGK